MMVSPEFTTEIEKKFYLLGQKIAEEEGFILYDMEYRKRNALLCYYIMRSDAQSLMIDDCVQFDRAVDPYLEEEWVPEELTLEVSSPGIYRKLTCWEHFLMSVGERLKVKVSAENLQGVETSNPKKSFVITGLLKEAQNGKITMTVEGEEDQEISLSDVVSAQADPLI